MKIIKCGGKKQQKEVVGMGRLAEKVTLESLL
jgi:hypothetical protein